jgi:hypothetical protein
MPTIEAAERSVGRAVFIRKEEGGKKERRSALL